MVVPTVTRTSVGDRHPDGQVWASRARAREARIRAEELRARSAGALARSADLRVVLGSRDEAGDPDAVRGRLAAAETRIANLERALQSNRRIGMALGVLMARYRLTEQQAFDLLRRQSSLRNVKLAAIAEEIVYTGEM